MCRKVARRRSRCGKWRPRSSSRCAPSPSPGCRRGLTGRGDVRRSPVSQADRHPTNGNCKTISRRAPSTPPRGCAARTASSYPGAFSPAFSKATIPVSVTPVAGPVLLHGKPPGTHWKSTLRKGTAPAPVVTKNPSAAARVAGGVWGQAAFSTERRRPTELTRQPQRCCAFRDRGSRIRWVVDCAVCQGGCAQRGLRRQKPFGMSPGSSRS